MTGTVLGAAILQACSDTLAGLAALTAGGRRVRSARGGRSGLPEQRLLVAGELLQGAREAQQVEECVAHVPRSTSTRA